MDVHEIFKLQDQATSANLDCLPSEFGWCHRAIELALDSHTFIANDSAIVAHREHLRDSDERSFIRMNVVVNLAYDATGTLISALRLLHYGVLADAWSLTRVAFESTCYAEFFARNVEKVPHFLVIAEKIRSDRSAHLANALRNSGLSVNSVLRSLEELDHHDRRSFYSRLSTFGSHASPVRSGCRIRMSETECRSYLSIGHRDLVQCATDLAAVAQYVTGIPFETWPGLMQKEPALVVRHKALEEEFKHIFARTSKG